MSPELVVVDIGSPTPAPTSDACATTLADVIARTRRELLTGRREERNRLTSDITAGAGSMDFDFPIGSIQPGTRLAIDLEVFHVYSVTGSTAVVEPADEGSTAAPHDAGAIVRVNSRASDFDILNATNDTLRELSSPGSGLFRVTYVDLVYNPVLDGYNLTDVTNLQDVLEVYYPEPSNTQRWIKVPPKGYRLQRVADTSEFASGFNLTFFRGFAAQQGATIRVAYKTSYLLLAAYTDNVESVAGLHCDAHDLLQIGAAIRLSDGREIDRNQTRSQGEPRRASEVPAGAQNNAPAGLQRRWLNRIRSEAARLAREWPSTYR